MGDFDGVREAASSLSGGASDVWEIMATASWIANTGFPLGVTLGGLVVAVALVKRQLSSDRLLRVADRRQEVAGRLGNVVNQALERLLSRPDIDPFWSQFVWPDADHVRREVGEAAILLTDAGVEEVSLLVEDLAAAWQVSAITAWRQKPHPDVSIHKDGVRRALEPYLEALRIAARELRRWDGLGHPPIVPTTLDHIARTYSEGKTTADTKAGRSARQAAYRNDEGSLVAVKAFGRRMWATEMSD